MLRSTAQYCAQCDCRFKLVVNVVGLSANFKPKRTAAASRGFLAIARLSCSYWFIELILFWIRAV